VTARELTPAITVLQLFLSSPKAAMRFAALRTLNRVAQSQPLAVTACNLDMEHLIDDPNRSIATLAITTLLKTGSAGSVDRLMKKIGTFMNDITDEFKVRWARDRCVCFWCARALRSLGCRWWWSMPFVRWRSSFPTSIAR
jgi:coatomer protein complex subunit gamma